MWVPVFIVAGVCAYEYCPPVVGPALLTSCGAQAFERIISNSKFAVKSMLVTFVLRFVVAMRFTSGVVTATVGAMPRAGVANSIHRPFYK